MSKIEKIMKIINEWESTDKSEIMIALNKELFDKIREDNFLAEDLSDEEITEHVEDFLNELSTPAGLALILENLDYFNQ